MSDFFPKIFGPASEQCRFPVYARAPPSFPNKSFPTFLEYMFPK